MSTRPSCKHIAGRIRETLKRGMIIEKDVLHYIDSTCPVASADEFRRMLTDPAADAHNASLSELVFSPGQDFQRDLEAMLDGGQYCKTDKENVLACLLAQPLDTRLTCRDGRFSLELAMPETAVDRFVSQLNIDRPMDRRLTDALRRHLDSRHHADVNLRLRNRRFELSDSVVAFLCDLIEALGPGSEDFLPCFEFMLDLFGESAAIDDVYRFLVGKKRFYFKALQASEKSLALWETSNMETLLLQGVRTPHIDPAETGRRMAMIDKVTRAVFGRTEYYERHETAVRVDAYDPYRDHLPSSCAGSASTEPF